jgi:hypothetical protein|tara:strand:- start:346 stop:723 length:378 start_codon:yes stop_codon:yes gene_type:complete
MTTEASEAKTFDVSKYQIGSDVEEHEVTIPETGESFKVKIREMSWSRRTKLMTECVKWVNEKDTQFDADAFMRASLREILVEAPWGRTTETFLLSIDARLGAALEKLVPLAASGGGNPEEIKKDV